MGELAIAYDLGDEFVGALPPHRESRQRLTDADIRRAVERIPDLSAREDQLLVRLCGLSLERGYAWMNQADLAKLQRCSERCLRDTIHDLCERELLVTVRTRDGLRYFPQWEALGLQRVPPVEREPGPAKLAGLDRQKMPMHLRSTIGSDKKNSSSAQARSPAAALSAKPSLEEVADAPRPAVSPTAAVHSFATRPQRGGVDAEAPPPAALPDRPETRTTARPSRPGLRRVEPVRASAAPPSASELPTCRAQF